MLRVENVSHRFGGLEVLRNVDFNVEAGELLGVIGPNGAGKTTLFNVVTGFVRPSIGRIHLNGRDITGYPAHRLVKLGLVRTFQGARVFPAMTVAECLAVAGGSGDGADVDEIVHMLELESWLSEEARSLPSGVMRLLGMAMARSTGARILLLDEPAAGLSAQETELLQMSIRRLNETGVTIVVVDHNLHFLMTLVSRALVLDAGRLIADGAPAVVTAQPQVIEAYIGGADLAED